MFKKLQKLLSSNSHPSSADNQMEKHIQTFEQIVVECFQRNQQGNYINTTAKESKTYQNLYQQPPDIRADFITTICQWNRFEAFKKRENLYAYDDKNEKGRKSFWLSQEILGNLLRSKLPFSEDGLSILLHYFMEYPRLYSVSVGSVLKQIEFFVEKEVPSEALKDDIKKWRDFLNENAYVREKKEVLVLDEILYKLENGGKRVVLADENDNFGKEVNQYVALQPAILEALYDFLSVLQKASGSKPSAKLIVNLKATLATLPASQQLQTVTDVLKLLATHKPETIIHTNTHNGNQYTWESHIYLTTSNTAIGKGLAWLAPELDKSGTMALLLAQIAEKSYQKIPGHGPASAAVGNACIFALSEMGFEGVAHLSRLKLRIKQASTQALIQNYIAQAANKLGVTSEELEDMAVPHFGLENNQIEETFGEYKATLFIESIQKTVLKWKKGESLLKTEPTAVKTNFKTELKALKDQATQIQKMLSAQRDRIDRMFILERIWTKEAFEKSYLNHGLMQFITKQLIWTFENNGEVLSGFWQDKSFKTLDLQEIVIDKNTQIRLWHPIGKSVEEIRLWRVFMETHEIKQPLKQAFREVYILTDAEINTHSYSNRMAAHILKQHQFNTLAKLRGWKYSLLGAYDKGYSSEIARLELPQYQLCAEFWVQEVDADGEWNDTGIWHYISTDQIRFKRLNAQDETVPLLQIPPIVLSEVLRDADLFVGVASVGNDPTWRDNGGVHQFRTYWENYSFGDLNELSKTRKSILERLVPKLKIAKVTQIEGNFLVVKGKLRTYKIHLGSGNILMKPNDQYLCIVPDRSAKSSNKNVPFLPFEGDNILSIILSKAFLLAEDDKITDSTIVSQIKRK